MTRKQRKMGLQPKYFIQEKMKGIGQIDNGYGKRCQISLAAKVHV